MYVHKMDVLNAKQYGQVMWQAYVNDGLDPNTNGLGYHYNWGYNTAGYPVLNSISMSKYPTLPGRHPPQTPTGLTRQRARASFRTIMWR